MGIGGGINGGNLGYIGVVTIVEYFSTLYYYQILLLSELVNLNMFYDMISTGFTK